jgi:gluconate 2-dehydrogenase gamma chain
MKRRDNIKLLLAGGLGASIVTSAESCKNEEASKSITTTTGSSKIGVYGRTEEEKKHDAKVIAETFFTDAEYKTVSILSDIIIPKDDVSGSATDAGVPDFIEFMMKDQPTQQLPMRGGLQWLDNQCQNKYGKPFRECTSTDQIAMIDLIAYPEKAAPDMKHGVKFFNMMRNLVATGFYTSQIGVKDIGYKGNQPNEWDGVPPEVMAKHGVALEEKYKDLYIKPAERNEVMKWT